MAENILHFGAIRFRVNGQYNMKLSLYSLDDTYSTELLPLPITELPGREPTRRCNFMAQRAKLKISTDKINEYVKINRIVIFAKARATSYPM